MTRRMMMARRAALAVVAALALAGAGVAGWMAHLGYFGGQLYFEVPARPLAPAARPLAPPGTVAVIFSGDMGFRVGMGPQIAQRLAADGVPAMGVSSLVHFRRPRDPEATSRFIIKAARHALAWAHADRLILIGQSFGADMLQVGATRLPPDLRARVQTVVLVVPGNTVVFHASPAELFNMVKPDAPALPTARQLTWAPALCIRGSLETDSLCPLMNGMANVQRVVLPGGHTMRRDPVAIYGAIRAQIAATAGLATGIDRLHAGSVPALAIAARPAGTTFNHAPETMRTGA